MLSPPFPCVISWIIVSPRTLHDIIFAIKKFMSSFSTKAWLACSFINASLFMPFAVLVQEVPAIWEVSGRRRKNRACEAEGIGVCWDFESLMCETALRRHCFCSHNFCCGTRVPCNSAYETDFRWKVHNFVRGRECQSPLQLVCSPQEFLCCIIFLGYEEEFINRKYRSLNFVSNAFYLFSYKSVVLLHHCRATKWQMLTPETYLFNIGHFWNLDWWLLMLLNLFWPLIC